MLGVKGVSQATLKVRTQLIENCFIINFNSDIKEIAIKVKQKNSIKLPDAIIGATSLYMSLPLVTADKSFAKLTGLDLRLLKIS